MKKIIILNVVVIMIAVFLTGCQQQDVLPASTGGLFLKSAQAGQTASVMHFSDGEMEKFYYPNNLLFEITPSSTAKVLNNFFLEVRDYSFSADNQVTFLISEAGSKVVSDSNVDKITANKLPFTVSDYGQQGIGDSQFNGLLKADHYVIAINTETNKFMLYDLNSGKLTTSTLTIKSDIISFDLGSLRFIKNSPVGNIFEFSIENEKYPAYTLD